MLIFLFTLAYAKQCEFLDQEIHDIPTQCTNVTIIGCNITCLNEQLAINTLNFTIFTSLIKDCINFQLNSENVLISSLKLENAQEHRYLFNSSGEIILSNHIHSQNSKASLYFESQNNIEILNAIISANMIRISSHQRNVFMVNSSIVSVNPQCKMRNGLYSNLHITAFQNFTLDKNSSIYASTNKITASSLSFFGDIISPYDCLSNEGKGKAPKFAIETTNCPFSGGSSAGQGGSGSQEFLCSQLEKAGKQFIHSKPYNNQYQMRSGSGGASMQSFGSGGGMIALEATHLIIINGLIQASGVGGFYVDQSIGQGGGGGGVIYIKADIIKGLGLIAAKGGDSDKNGIVGEGGGGLVIIQGLLEELNQLKATVESGSKKLRTAQHGSIILSPCQDGYARMNLQCVKCISESIPFAKRGQCFRCPGVPYEFSNWPKCNEILCDQFYCDPIKFISEISGTFLNFTLLFSVIFFIAIGYVIRRMYRMKEIKYEKLPFDFESATRYMTLDHLLTDELMKNNNFQLIDLMYHVHRITLVGNNSAEFPWRLPIQPDSGINYLMDIEEYKRFAQKINKIAEWTKKDKVILFILSVIYYPLYWVFLTQRKKKKYLKIVEYFNQSKFMKVVDDQFIKIKLSKSADYTLLYLDIFNYRMSDLRYFFLACPYYILLSGEGTFLRPLYLCESNPFLSCLYFSINRNKEIHEERNKILDNLVTHKKRMENSQQLNKFIIKFNRYARAIDRDSNVLFEDVKQLIVFCTRWNQKFFSNFQITINIIIIIGEEFTILENYDSPKFKQFILDNKDQHVRFGLFVYDFEADPEEIEDVLDNQRISLEESGQLQMLEDENEGNEHPMEDLKHQYIERIEDTYVESISLMESETSKIEKVEKKKNQFLGRIRYWFLSHKVPSVGSNTKIYLQLILSFFDAMFLLLLLQQSNQSRQFFPQQIMLYCFPYPLSVIFSPILGCLWMTTQSYGIAKAHAIFGSLSIFNLLFFISFMIQELSIQATLVLITEVVVKGLLAYNTKRVLSLNIKLNKLNQLKHIIQ